MPDTSSLLAHLRLDAEHDGLSYRAVSLADLTAYGLPAAVILGAVKAALHGLVDAEAERRRSAYVTPGAGQAMEYQEVQAEALAALSGPPAEATPERYAMLAASIGLDRDPQTGTAAADVLGVARSVDTAYRLWRMAGAAIRAARLQGKAAIAAAGTPEAAAAAYAAIAWPSLD